MASAEDEAPTFICLVQEHEGDAALAKKATFTKLDLTALIASKQLRTKDAVLAYVQQHGTAAMQAYVSRVQHPTGFRKS